MNTTLPQTYWGARFTADAADCNLPITIDGHSGCTFNCLYCFSNSLMRDVSLNKKKCNQLKKMGVSQTEFNIEKLKKLLRGDYKGKLAKIMNSIFKDNITLQMGGLGDPFDNMEYKTKWTYKALEFFIENKIPLRISTKGAKILMQKEYLDLLKGAKNIWIAFSIISPDDDILKKIDIGTPSAKERFECMQALSEIGVTTSLRYRPIIRKLANSIYLGKPQYQVMVDRAVQSGAKSISFETIFLNQRANNKQIHLYKMLSKIIDDKYFLSKFKYYSIRNQACLRENRLLKYKLLMNIRNYSKNNGLVVGISEPHFKEYSDFSCCCGISRKDPVFGNYSTSLTDIVIIGRKHYEKYKENLKFKFTDWVPEWSKYVNIVNMANNGDKYKKICEKNHTWYDTLRTSWNNPSHKRSPFNYFEGILHPLNYYDENNNLIYEYRHWAGQIYKIEELPKLEVELNGNLVEECSKHENTLEEIRTIANNIGRQNGV